MARRLFAALATLLVLACASTPPAPPAPKLPDVANYEWVKLDTEPYKGKQDDIVFVTPDVGWYVNGAGKIFKTTDGGRTWTLKLHKPGTYFRCIAFVDEKRGFAGNIGPDYFPGVTDATPLYETRDGGETWTAVTTISGPVPKGLCAIDVVRQPFINAGVLDHKVTITAAGRVGGPAFLLTSTDGGEHWQSADLSSVAGMLLDVKFLDEKNGFLAAATKANVAESNALILRTDDGGKSWTKVYQSARPYEATWKMSFPTRSVGYVTIQSYDPDKNVSQRYVAKSHDGGRSWVELPVVNDHAFREFGIAFLDANTGWIGGSTTGVETRDGGATWTPVAMGRAVNKIRLVGDATSFAGYAIGVDVYKLQPKKPR